MRGGGALFPVKDECRPYRLDVVPQFLFAVKRHIRAIGRDEVMVKAADRLR